MVEVFTRKSRFQAKPDRSVSQRSDFRLSESPQDTAKRLLERDGLGLAKDTARERLAIHAQGSERYTHWYKVWQFLRAIK